MFMYLFSFFWMIFVVSMYWSPISELAVDSLLVYPMGIPGKGSLPTYLLLCSSSRWYHPCSSLWLRFPSTQLVFPAGWLTPFTHGLRWLEIWLTARQTKHPASLSSRCFSRPVMDWNRWSHSDAWQTTAVTPPKTLGSENRNLRDFTSSCVHRFTRLRLACLQASPSCQVSQGDLPPSPYLS